MQSRKQRRCSLPNFSQKVAIPCAQPLRVINATDENDITVLSDLEKEPDSSPGSRSSLRTTQWYSKIFSLKDDIEAAYARLGSQIKSGFNNMKTHLIPSSERQRGSKKSPRCLIVHYLTEDKTEHKKRKCSTDEEEDELNDSGYFESMDRNYSPSLIMHPLREGKFSAHISLNSFPSEDDIVVKVRRYKLDIYQQKTNTEGKDGSKDKQRHQPRTYKCGEIDLPIYVDSSTLKFAVDNECDLYMQGHMKGSMGQRLSLSADDLIINGVNSPKRQNKTKSIWHLHKSKEAEGNDSTIFRDRTYTSSF